MILNGVAPVTRYAAKSTSHVHVLKRTFSETKSPLHAVVIGINKFLFDKDLRGAVNDANAFAKFLEEKLQVPKAHIQNLRDEQATRENIIKAFLDLRDNRDIQPQDPIVIYYAGHGSEINAPPGWESGGRQIQCLVPHDASDKTGINAIPDVTVAALLNMLADAKGNNIVRLSTILRCLQTHLPARSQTLILDCCHSAGGSRDESYGRHAPGERLPPLPSDFDADILRAAYPTSCDLLPSGFDNQAMSSHVLLAACGRGETAQEIPNRNRGHFTYYLLKLLESIGVDKLTYRGCMQRLKLEWTAQCVSTPFFASAIVG